MSRILKLHLDQTHTASTAIPLRRRLVMLIMLGLGIWISGIILAPFLAALPHPLARKTAAFIYFFYQPVCHQLPERSAWINGYPMAVCIRCLAFYMGGLMASAACLYRGMTHLWSIRLYAFFVFPALADFLLEKLNVYHNMPSLRLVTGFLLGFAFTHLLVIAISGQARNPLAKTNRPLSTESAT